MDKFEHGPGRPGINGKPAHPPQRVSAVVPTFTISQRSDEFRRRHFKGVTPDEWNDWHWQLRNRIRDRESLERVFQLSDDERATIDRIGGRLPVGHHAVLRGLIDPDDPEDPLRKTMVPVADEFFQSAGRGGRPARRGRATARCRGSCTATRTACCFLVTSFCAVYCRYCTRARLVGHTGEYHFNEAQFERALDYIAASTRGPRRADLGRRPADAWPTTGSSGCSRGCARSRTSSSCASARRCRSCCRSGSRRRSCAMLRKYHPLWMSIHFMHPDELTPEVAEACGRLADAGIPLGSQTVLLQGRQRRRRDDEAARARAAEDPRAALLPLPVRPDPRLGALPHAGREGRSRSSSGLRGHTTGYAVPTYVVDAPGGGGKIPLLPDYVVGPRGRRPAPAQLRGQDLSLPGPGPRTPACETE